MTELHLLRQLYGNVYITALPDGRYIPWKLLPIKDYLEFEALKAVGTYTSGQLEDEAFEKCVLDPLIIENMDQLKAGTVSAVAVSILESSGPQSVDELNHIFQANRALIQNAIHQIVSMVCQAFPGYTPDDVYEMNYETLMLRAALAEDKLLKAGIATERLVFEQENVPQEAAAPKLDSRKLFDRFERQQGRPPAPQPPPKSTKTTVITGQDVAEATVAYTGHERSDKILRESQMVNETVSFYGDYLKQMKDGKKVVIPSHEELKRTAKARAEENKKKYEALLKEKVKPDPEEWQRLLKVREKARARKAKKRR